ncbi:glutamate racemase [Coriobacteriales bacterium OH1046]|nr:glutamate racemase [Coriobacteriales bacterium OH1046]
MRENGNIAVFDSGVGGISVLRALVEELPHERFLYFGDSANAPYGEKSEAQILRLTHGHVEGLVDHGAKAVVIACNTATSVAGASLREAYPDTLFIGVEPALKPAAEAYPGGSILVMATPVTLALDKYHDLARTFDETCSIHAVACPKLAGRIERGKLDAPDVRDLVEDYVGPYRGKVDAVVLGCTHYPFIAPAIRRVLGDVELFDGGAGTARHLRRRLASANELAPDTETGAVEFLSSLDTPEEYALYDELFSMDL